MTKFQTVRRPTAGLIGRLKRIEERLLRKARPEFQVSSYVRGARVAIDYLLHAFLKYSQRAEFAFVVPDARREEFERWVAINRQDDACQILRTYAATEVPGRGLADCVPDIWLNLHGDVNFALRVRDRLSDRMYPTVTVQHGLSAHFLLYDRFLRTMLTPSYACDSIVCTSNACKRAVANLLEGVAAAFHEQLGGAIGFSGRLDVIPLCVDTDQLLPRDKTTMRRQLGVPQDALMLLYVGYLSQAKADLVPLLRLVRELVDHNQNSKLQFIVAGTGPESYGMALQRLIEELGLTRAVTFYREVSDRVKAQLLAAADIFVAPCDSMQESFGLTPVEAMACGLPQVVADWSGYRETVVHGETGFLIPTCWGSAMETSALRARC